MTSESVLHALYGVKKCHVPALRARSDNETNSTQVSAAAQAAATPISEFLSSSALWDTNLVDSVIVLNGTEHGILTLDFFKSRRA